MLEIIMPGLVCFCAPATMATLLSWAAKADRKIDRKSVDRLRIEILICFLWVIAGLSLFSVGIAALLAI